MPITRRQMLATAAVGSAVSIGCGQSVAAATQQSPALQPLSQRVKYCLNTSTVRGQKLGIVEQVELCSRAGYQAIEPWIGDLRRYVEEGGQLAELGKRIADAGLGVESAIGFARWIVDDPQARQDGLAEARRDMEMLAAIGGKRIAAPPIGAHTETGPDLPVIAERYRALLELGDQTGVVPQLELWGFSRTLSRLGELAYVAVEAGHPAACVLPDVYHIYKGGSSFAGLSMLAASKIHVFHMNDYPAQPVRAEIKDSDRVYPGDGVAPLDTILGDLDRNGFAGVLSLELFNETYWAQPADLVATTGLEKMRAAVARADSKAITAAP